MLDDKGKRLSDDALAKAKIPPPAPTEVSLGALFCWADGVLKKARINGGFARGAKKALLDKDIAYVIPTTRTESARGAYLKKKEIG